MNALSRFAPPAARIFLGLIYFVFGLNGFLNFAPQPPLPEAAGAFIGALVASGYMFPFIMIVEVLGGAMLLSGRFVPLALTVLAPITVNIFAFHAALVPSGMVFPVLMIGAQAYLAWAYRDAFRGVLAARAAPARTEDSVQARVVSAA
jgi:uncharacterized membrane protein YphA (DoxX/SURF4 family)